MVGWMSTQALNSRQLTCSLITIQLYTLVALPPLYQAVTIYFLLQRTSWECYAALRQG